VYLEHFGLTEAPFRITPHTDVFFAGADRGATLDALMYAILHDEGIVKVSGEVGSGKTMLCRVLMERLPPSVDTIYLATPSFARDEILQAIADELDLRLSHERMTVALRQLQEHLIGLYAAQRRVVILIDEAHVMPEETLEQVRLLSNLESSRHKLLQIVLFGQPELDSALARPSLRQLKDRVTHAFSMRALTAPEVAAYISFRMRGAGYRGPEVFTPRAVALISRASEGLTRRINILADKSLLAAFTENAHAITERHARAAIADSDFVPVAKRKLRPAAWVAAALVAGIALGAAVQRAFFSPDPAGAWRGAPVAGTLQAPAPAALAAGAAVQPPREAGPGAGAPAASPPPQAAPAPVHAALASVASLPAPRQEAAVSPLTPEQLRRISAYSPAGQALLAERLAATRERLERIPGERYSIELFITENTDPARMERFLARARELVPLQHVFVIPMPEGARMRLRVVYGEFADRGEAAAAQRLLPPRYQEAFRASPRSFAELRSQI
jgi:type II secretory pathway predicted ATPase ExeA